MLHALILSIVSHALPVVRMRLPEATVSVEVAQRTADMERGLMWRKTVPAHTGMLFVFQDERPVEFWMKDTLVPLDIVFISSTGKVAAIAPNVPAWHKGQSESDIARRYAEAEYVLELPAGEARRDGIAIGTQIEIPMLPAANPGEGL